MSEVIEKSVETALMPVFANTTLEEETRSSLIKSFETFFNQTEEWKQKAEGLVITSADQKAEMKMAREARLALKNIRVETEKTRKKLKEDSLRKGQTIDAIAKIITNQILPIEEHLEEQEKFVELQEAKAREERRVARVAELEPYQEFVPYGIDLGGMTDEDYTKLLNGAKLQLQSKIEEERRAEEERLAREKAEAEERAERERMEKLGNDRANLIAPYRQFLDSPTDPQSLALLEDEGFVVLFQLATERKAEHDAEQEKIRVENERLRKEAEEREAAIKAEREAAEAKQRELEEKARKEREAAEAEQQRKLAAEREERERVEAELRAKKEAEERAEAERQAAAEAELSKGDKEKFSDLIADLTALKGKYQFKSKKYQALQNSVNELLDKTIVYASNKAA